MKRYKRYSNYRPTLLTLFSAVVSIPLMAQTVGPTQCGWHDHMYLQPGDGVQLNRQQEPAFPGLVIMSPTGTSSYVGVGHDDTYLASQTYDMLKTLNVNGSISLNALVVDADVNVSFFGRQTFNENDFVFIERILSPPLLTTFPVIRFCPAFTNELAVYRKSLQNTALYSALTGTFGTHYVTGYQSQNIVFVAYTFHYASTSVKQRSSISSSVSSGPVDIVDVATQAFADTNATTSLSYRFYSSDPNLLATNLGVAAVGIIKTPQEITNFYNNIHAYFSFMTHPKITGYSLDSIGNVPGFSQLGLNNPTTNYSADYNTFFQDYNALQTYKQTLDPWILGGNSTPWLNALGRQTLLNDWFGVENALAELKAIVVNHFATNAPLNVPSDVAAFLANNLSMISLPTMYAMQNVISGSDRYFVGRVDCGCRELTTSIPFCNVSELQSGTNNGTLATIYYDPVVFEDIELKSSLPGAIKTDLQNLFKGPDWQCYTNVATNPNRNGYFLVTQPVNEQTNWSLAISGGTDANGNPITLDEVPLTYTASGSCPGSCTVTFTNLVRTPVNVVPLTNNAALTGHVDNQISAQTGTGNLPEPIRAEPKSIAKQ